MGNNTAGSWQPAKAVYEYLEPGGPALGDLPARVALLTQLSERLDFLESQDAMGEVAESLAHAGLVDECLEALSHVTSDLDEDEVNFTGYAHIAPTHWSWAALGLARAGCREAAEHVAGQCLAWLSSGWDSAQARAQDRVADVRVMVGTSQDTERTDIPELLAEAGLVDQAIAVAAKTEPAVLRTKQLAEVARMCTRAGNPKRATGLVTQALDLARLTLGEEVPDAGSAVWAIADALARLGQVEESLDWLHESSERGWVQGPVTLTVALVANAAASGSPAALELAHRLPYEKLRAYSLSLTCAFADSGNVAAAEEVANLCYKAALARRSYGDENVDVCCALAAAGLIDQAHEAWKDTRSLRNTGMFSIRNETCFQGHVAAAWVLQGDLDKAVAIADEEKNASLWSVDPVAYISRALILGRTRLQAR